MATSLERTGRKLLRIATRLTYLGYAVVVAVAMAGYWFTAAGTRPDPAASRELWLMGAVVMLLLVAFFASRRNGRRRLIATGLLAGLLAVPVVTVALVLIAQDRADTTDSLNGVVTVAGSVMLALIAPLATSAVISILLGITARSEPGEGVGVSLYQPTDVRPTDW